MTIGLACLKPTDDEGRRTSKELEKRIAVWMKEYEEAIKLLLLGTAESGKTTIIKQMKILHISGFTESERKEKIQDIRSNILETVLSLVINMSSLDPAIKLENPDNQSSCEFMRKIDSPDTYRFPEEFYYHAERLWKDEGIQKCYRRGNEFQLLDCAKYFMDKIAEVRQPNYVPSDQDIIHSRRRTSNIQKIEFEVRVPKKYGGGVQKFWMFDVGGQRGERKKWIQVFEGIHAILFLVASSSFNQTLEEDNKTNRLVEALDLFRDIWLSRFLQAAGFIVFLNKQDILKKRIEDGMSIAKYFPDYNSYELGDKDPQEDPNDEYSKTRCFIRDMFIEVTKREQPAEVRKISIGPGFGMIPEGGRKRRECYWHFTTATDTRIVQRVFQDVHTMIIMWNLGEIGCIQ